MSRQVQVKGQNVAFLHFGLLGWLDGPGRAQTHPSVVKCLRRALRERECHAQKWQGQVAKVIKK